MKRTMTQATAKKVGLGAGMLFCLSLMSAQSASAVTVLPDPTSTFDGLPVAIQEDQFVSYSAKLLTLWGFSGFNTAAGTGGLDVILATGSGGTDNTPVAGGFNFEDPAPTPNGAMHTTFSDTWGAGLRPNGPVLVDDVLGYLHNRFGPTDSVPVFTFDMNQDGAHPDLRLVAKMTVYDPVSHTDIATWALDAINNGTFDPSAYVLAPGTLSLTGTSGTTYTVDNNKGSGKNDFIDFAPTMDLSLYAGHGYEFHVFGNLIDLNGGHEEIWLSGALAPPGTTPPTIPEPSSLLLLGSGLMGVLGLSGSRKRA